VLRQIMACQIGSNGLKLVVVGHGDEQIIGGPALPRLAHAGNDQTGHAMVPAILLPEGLAGSRGHDQPDTIGVGQRNVFKGDAAQASPKPGRIAAQEGRGGSGRKIDIIATNALL